MSVIVVTLVGLAMVALFALTEAPASGKRSYKVVLDDAFGLIPQGDFRIGGVLVGETTQLGLTDSTPPKALITAVVTRSGAPQLGVDAHCAVRQQSLIGEYYLDCEPGRSSQPLHSGAVIPVTRTSSAIPLDLSQDMFRLPYNERMGILIDELGAGLTGRGEDLRAVLLRADPAYAEAERVLGILASEHRTLADYVRRGEQVTAALVRHARAYGHSFTASAVNASLLTTHRAALVDALHILPSYLRALRSNADQTTELADTQLPLLRALGAQADSLTQYDRLAVPYSLASLKNLRTLAASSKAGRRSLAAATPANREALRGVRELPALALVARQFLQSMDTRSRSVMANSQAAQTAPPAPDPTSANAGRGYTGNEALLRLIYNYTLTFNGFDSLSHFMRSVNFITPCSLYEANPSPALIKDCGSYFGPNQPGVNTLDPTAPASGTRAHARRGKTHGRTAAQAARPPAPSDHATSPGIKVHAPTGATGPLDQVANTLGGAAASKLGPLLSYLLAP